MAIEAANDSGASLRETVGEAEWRLRVELAAAYRLVAHFGWDELVFNHLTARVPGPEHHFLINPFGLLFEEITASSLVKIDVNGNKVLDSPFPVNPAGFIIHSAIHRAREDALCIMHVHSVAGAAVASQAEGLLPLTQNALTQWTEIACHDYEGLAIEPGERERLVADLGARQILILRNHGLLTIGRDVGEAFLRLYFLERACEMQIAAQAGGADLLPLPASMAERVAAQARTGFGQPAALVWQALMRKAERLDPEFMC